MGTSLIRGRYVFARTPDGNRAAMIEDAAVVQRDGTIVEVGPAADLIERHRLDEILGSPDHVVLPGLVNSHHHVGLTPFQLGSPDYPLELWFASRLAARDVDPYLDTLYSSFDLGGRGSFDTLAPSRGEGKGEGAHRTAHRTRYTALTVALVTHPRTGR